MEPNIILCNRIYDLKKKINLLEWDLSILENDNLKDSKQRELMRCRKELEELERLSKQRIIPERRIRR